MLIKKYFEIITNDLIINENKLNKLDAAIGDGDYGSNVVKGFKYILDQSSSFTQTSSLQSDLMTCAKQFMDKIGGSSGFLTGVVFMALAQSFQNKITITNQDIGNALKAACERISQLGKTKVGEKTMLDALYPAAIAMCATTDVNINFVKAAEAAHLGAESTINMKATKGRSSYLGERSIGHMDPGACAIAIIFKSLTKI
ncbi:MAG: dihydroxyacetone kinase subunit L [Mycoplasmataceae bacterium]|jgi:dihydroxyacetone kinase-like protein|nr:dihydroxyacetone kinase subunit L [Mycoplasmataceae bacterium]